MVNGYGEPLPDWLIRRARRAGLIAAILAFPFVAIGWLALDLVLWASAGGGIGGLGAADQASKAWWQWPALLFVTGAAVRCELWVAHLAYRRIVKKHASATAENQ
jgi:hypothetical protein